MTKRKISLFTLFISIFMLSVLAACSSQETDATSGEEAEGGSESTEESSSEYPIVIEHAFGETVIEEKPERVATVQWANHDVALALGVEPVGFSAANYGVQDDSGMLPWTKEKLDELGVEDPNIFQDTDGLDFEAVADSNPDVILAAYSGITQEDYDILSQIAPVVAYKEAPWVTTWREQVLMNAKGMGMEEEGQQLIEETEKFIQEKAEEYPEIQGKTVAFASFSADNMSQIYVYTPADPRGKFLEELGMTYPDSVLNAIEDESNFALTLSAENADVLNDADILIGYGDESLYEAVKADPLLGEIPAIQRGSVVFIGNGTPLAASGNPNPLSIQYTLDEYLKLIGDAAAKLDE
ncbi:iron-siderophore ABC transporter substrate-binding protein [Halobacillus litoralis]|uniref:iron-siderophore ABC transporter substrate-binding protein n=1 Tax=Halobacillus litoralis TaxID=45668 RepID=UPI001CD7C8CE|nr:iron-siderophore ABC transporter substrate-binding protein [Halobacillus litoralis]MCA0972173.1 iron-siderophore ABC transporter substrate-binding protein [Halobacillus litoralis]